MTDTFGNNPVTVGTPVGTPLGTAYVPNTPNGDLTPIEGIAINTDSGSPPRKSTAIRLGLKDGDNVTQGLIADVAVVGDNPGTVSAKLRGLTKIFNDVWDSVNHRLHVAVDNATPLGQAPMSASSPVALSSDHSPVSIENMIQKAIRTGTAWSVTTGKVNSGAALNSVPVSFFLPVTSTKNVYIYSIEFMCGATVNADLRIITVDPAWGTALTPINDKSGGSAIGSTLNITTVNSAQAVAGTPWRAPSALANVHSEVFPTNLGRLLSAGVASGIEMWLNISATNVYVVTIRWIEY